MPLNHSVTSNKLASRVWKGITCGIAVCCAFQSSALVFGQGPDSDPVLEAWGEIAEVVSCGRNCHYNPAPLPNVVANRFSASGDFARGTELREWLENDKHAIARLRVEPFSAEEVRRERERLRAKFASLTPSMAEQWVGESNELSSAICKQLGINVNTTEGYAEFAQSCLTCHGGFSAHPEVSPRFQSPKIAPAGQQPGISCMYCHQNPEVDVKNLLANDNWVLIHAGAPGAGTQSWRTLPPEAKARAGMRDLVTVSKQASLCNDCHVGNVEKGMFVTHEMYAAGHPPLPNVELATFNRSMPQHWRSQGDQIQAMTEAAPEELVDGYVAANFPGLQKQLLKTKTPKDRLYWNTRSLLVGAVMAKKYATDLLLSAAGKPNQFWGDFAFYDCGACHHELKQPSLRQERGYAFAPGRPRLYEWSDALFVLLGSGNSTSLGKPIFGSDPKIQDLFKQAVANDKELAETISRQPFGRAMDVKQDAKTLADDLDKLVQALESDLIVDAEFTLRLIEQFSDVSKNELLDYATARQVLWALMVMTDELRNDKERPQLANDVLPAILREVEQWQSPPTNEGALISTGAVGIAAQLPAGRNMFIYRDNLGDELTRRAKYSPEDFSASLKRINDAIKSHRN